MYRNFEERGWSGRDPGSFPYSPPVWASFATYVRNRRYDFGRGTPEAWEFIAFARGDSGFPDPACWRDLHLYLTSIDADEALMRGARSAWKSYVAGRSRAGRGVGLSKASLS